MGNDRIRLVEDVFHEACELSGEARSAYLDRACGGDDALRGELDTLLAAHESADRFIDGSALGFFPELAGKEAEAAQSMVGRRVGAYQITGVIASGGMGSVYEATQEQPRRTVALKLMKYNVDSANALRRFQYESQILGRLQHPGIAQIFEAGTHQEGPTRIPFFAMEFVADAKTVVEYASAHRLSIPERLRLFARVCDAVQHGHQKGIIHRDLKPSNILCDATGAPKVIDFGVARAADSDAATATLMTDAHSMIGTLQYMSPEQCDSDPHGVDVRADVYALGVVLYELLCGQTPYQVLRNSITEAVETIRHRQPTRPSSLIPALRGDLETILLKSLEKEREARYQSAADFAQDIRRFLNSEPIEARPPSMAYQIRMFARRNKAFVRSAVAVLIMLIASAALSTTYAVIASRDRRAAESARVQADIHRAKAEQITSFLQDMLKSIRPETARGRDVSILRELLEQAALDVNRQFDSPEVKAAVLHTIGTTFHKIGRLDEADQQLAAAAELRREKLGLDHPETLETLNAIAELRLDQRRVDEAGAMFERNLATCWRVLNPGHRQTITVMNDYATYLFEVRKYTEAEKMLREAKRLSEAHSSTDPTALLMTLNNLAPVFAAQGKPDEAEAVYTEVLDRITADYGADHPQALITLNNLARLKEDRGLHEEAEELHASTLETMRRVLGDDHPTTLAAILNLGILLKLHNKLPEAVPYYRESVAAQRRLYGDKDPETQKTLVNYAFLLHDAKMLADAKSAYQNAIEVLERANGPSDQSLVTPLSYFGFLMLDLGKPEEAEPLMRRSMEIAEATYPEGELERAATCSHYGRILLELARYQEAEGFLLSSYEDIEAQLGPEDQVTADAAKRLVNLYRAWGKPDKAAEYEKAAGQ